MKNISTFLNVVLFVAVAVLYYLYFSNSENIEQEPGSIIVEKQDVEPGEAEIAFIDLEKLLVDYKLSVDMNADYSKRMEESQDRLDLQLTAYEKEVKTYQEKLKRGGFLSQRSAENQQKALLEKQQKLQMLQMELENQLLEEQQKLNIQLYDSVMNYLQEYNKIKNFRYIFSKMDGGGLLIGDPKLDITSHVVSVLNQRYSNTKE